MAAQRSHENPPAITIRLQPKQTELWEDWDGPVYTRLGFGGARGGAKSGGGRRCMFLRRLKYNATPGLILRRTHPELYKSHIIKLFEEFPQSRRWYNTQNKEMIFPNGSRLFFGSAEHEGDLANFYSAEFADIMVDEAQEFSQQELEKLTGSLRCTSNPRIMPKMVHTFMPGMSEAALPPKGLHYLKRVYHDGKLEGTESKRKWKFIKASAWDNIEWARTALGQQHQANGTWLTPQGAVSEDEFYQWSAEQRKQFFIEQTDFGQQLSALTDPNLRDAWLNGKFDVFLGQYFPNFSYERNTLEHADIKMERWHKRWISSDWGYDHPWAVHWHAQDEFGNVTTYREFVAREMGEAEMARKISELSEGETISAFFLSWDAFGALNPRTKKSVLWQLSENLGKHVPRPTPQDKSPGSRISGWRLMHQLLDSGVWQISRNCPKLIETLPSLIRDEKNPEDVLKVDYNENGIGDDTADSARYGLQNMLSGSVKPREVKRKELLESFDQRIERIRKYRAGTAFGNSGTDIQS